jgi:hypothetical protein
MLLPSYYSQLLLFQFYPLATGTKVPGIPKSWRNIVHAINVAQDMHIRLDITKCESNMKERWLDLFVFLIFSWRICLGYNLSGAGKRLK